MGVRPFIARAIARGWVRRTWIVLAVCAFIVLLVAVLFRIDDFVTLAHEPTVTLLYCAMVAAVYLGTISGVFLLIMAGVRWSTRHSRPQ